MSNISDFKSREYHESSTHALRFEAYELPKSSLPPILASSTELVPVSESSYIADIPESVQSSTNASSSDLKLRLDGVQRKWGQPSYSSVTPSSSTTNIVKIQNEPAQHESVSSKAKKVSYDSKKQLVEISPEKQKLAASLFGVASKSERRPTSGHKVSKMSQTRADVSVVKASLPPPDLLDLGDEPSVMSSTPAVDPFKQLEGLLDLTQEEDTTLIKAGATEAPNIMSIFADMSLNDSVGNPEERPSEQLSKGPNLKEALEKDARVRQLGVMPSGQNPNLFKDLLS